MDASRFVKWVAVIVLAVVAWRYALPWAKQQIHGRTTATAAADNSCTTAAQRASEAWGGGLHGFVNPPYDLNAWSSFRADVDAKIAAAQTECRCVSPSCLEARTAMSDLRSLVADLDSAIRSNSPLPDDAVQRQEAIDTRIETAVELARSGK